MVRSVADLVSDTKKVNAYLIVVSGQGSLGKMCRLDRGEMTIGRGGDTDIVLDDEGVSRRHAKILSRDGVVQRVDLNSTNGTFNNG